MSQSGSPPAGAKSRRMSRTTASGLHTLSEHSCRPISGVRCLPAGVRDRSGHRCVHCRFVPGQSRVVFISGALSVVLGYFTFRDFNNGAAVWMLARWIGVGFIFQGVTATALAIDVPALPERGWYVFVKILTVIAGVVTLVWPISSIVVLAIVAGAWLVVIGITEIVGALSARRTVKKGERRIQESLAPSTASRLTSVC